MYVIRWMCPSCGATVVNRLACEGKVEAWCCGEGGRHAVVRMIEVADEPTTENGIPATDRASLRGGSDHS